MKIEDVLNKTCLIGLSYINTNGDLLKQAQYAGTVIKVDAEEGMTVKLMAIDPTKTETPNFHIPPSLEAWFIAPKGHYKNAEHNIDIVDPDYFVTWDANGYTHFEVAIVFDVAGSDFSADQDVSNQYYALQTNDHVYYKAYITPWETTVGSVLMTDSRVTVLLS